MNLFNNLPGGFLMNNEEYQVLLVIFSIYSYGVIIINYILMTTSYSFKYRKPLLIFHLGILVSSLPIFILWLFILIPINSTISIITFILYGVYTIAGFFLFGTNEYEKGAFGINGIFLKYAQDLLRYEVFKGEEEKIYRETLNQII